MLCYAMRGEAVLVLVLLLVLLLVWQLGCLSRSCGSSGEAAPKSGGGGVVIRQRPNQGLQGI